VELDRNSVVARYFRARHAWQRGDLDQALSDLQIASERDPQNVLIATELGRVYEQRNDFVTAEQWLIKARNLKPDDPTTWKALAELYVGRSYGTPLQQTSTAQQLVQLTPDDAEARVWLGRAYLLNGERDAAQRELEKAVQLNPQLASAHFYLGRLFGRSTEAGRAEYERALALDPDGPIGAAAQRSLNLP
jgi:Flp pilus assembly protein TadD